MRTKLTQFQRFLILFEVLGSLYALIEIGFTAITSGNILSLKGHTSLWMIVIGGVIGILLGLFNEKNSCIRKLNMFWQSILGMLVIFAIEFSSGLLFNKVFKFDLWSYLGMPLNVMGQITFCFAPLWFLISPLAFWVDDKLREQLFDEPMTMKFREYYINAFKPTMKVAA